MMLMSPFHLSNAGYFLQSRDTDHKCKRPSLPTQGWSQQLLLSDNEVDVTGGKSRGNNGHTELAT